MRAILVSVDYWDLLKLTLPYNRHHFTDVMIVTSLKDEKTKEVAKKYDAQVHETNSFYENGATFNKWKALEEGLDKFGRHGILCIMDADIVWPYKIPPEEYQFGKIYTPNRLICPDLIQSVPEELCWGKRYRTFRDGEWAGYSQIFHAEDPVLPKPPWHSINWKHAGGADSDFQKLWTPVNKTRPSWKVLHIGLPGKNWCGRATPFLDGSAPLEARSRKNQLSNLMTKRKQTKSFKEELL